MNIRSRGTGIRLPLAALSGLLAGLLALAVAELVAAAVRPESGPVIAVGGAAIDRTPAALKEWAIRHFGTDDKLVLQLGILARARGAGHGPRGAGAALSPCRGRRSAAVRGGGSAGRHRSARFARCG